MRLGVDELVRIGERLAKVFAEKKDYLNELDGKLGDGDHGLSMARGFAAMASFLKETPPDSVAEALAQGGMQFNEVSGSTIGILMFSAMREAGKAAAGKEPLGLAELASLLEAAIRGIMRRGKASPGQKTILDSLQPALEALLQGLDSGQAEGEVLRAAAAAAEAGAEGTRALESTIGRARWFAERSRGELDPGAVSGALIVRTAAEVLLGG